MKEDDPDKWTAGLSNLISSYEISSETKLDKEVEQLPGITFREILTKLKELQENSARKGGAAPDATILEQVMVKWLKDVAPEKVNQRNLNAIHTFACSIYDRIEQKKPRPRDL